MHRPSCAPGLVVATYCRAGRVAAGTQRFPHMRSGHGEGGNGSVTLRWNTSPNRTKVCTDSFAMMNDMYPAPSIFDVVSSDPMTRTWD